MQKNTNKLGTMPVLKLIAIMSLPAIFSMFVQALYNVVDSVFVGMISTTDAEITALNYAFPLQMIIFAIAMGIGVGTNSLVSRQLGEKKVTDASKTAQTGLIIGICAYSIALIGCFFLPKLFMLIYNDTQEIESMAIDYVTITMGFSFGMFLEIIANKILQSTGNMKVPMFSQLIGAITNIILDPFFIFESGKTYHLPIIQTEFVMPFGLGMGVSGAAVATIIGQILAAIFVLIMLFTRKHSVSMNFKGLKIHFTTIKQIFTVGIAVTIVNSINSISTIIINKILNSTGVTVMGSYFKIQSFIFMPIFGLNQGIMPILGYNYGAREAQRFKKTFFYSIIIASCFLSIGLILFQTIPTQLLSMFSLSNEAMELGKIALRVISLSFLGAGVNIIVSSMFQAIGSGIKSMFLNILRQAVFLIPLVFFINLITKDVRYVWWAFPIAEFACLILFLPITISTFKKIMRMAKPTEDNPLITTS